MTARRFATLAEWLAWQETLHHSKIDLGLSRVAAVARNLIDIPPDFPVVTVAGTNGKGSVCAFVSSILTAAGFKTGVFSSPHLLRYNERIRINGRAATDEELVRAFELIDEARADTTLTYFEYSTLAALQLFNQASVDCAVLEVGMGGRLDAVNIIDADVAVISNIGLDHQEWLGSGREQIAREKAGILRAGAPAVCGDRDPPKRLLEEVRASGAIMTFLGSDFDVTRQTDSWTFYTRDQTLPGLPLPALAGTVQIDNAATAIATLRALGDLFPLAIGHIRAGLTTTVLPGRIQVIRDKPAWILDVCHNPEAARVLSGWLAESPCAGRTRVVLGMLADKDVEGVVTALAANTHDWYLASLAGDRGLSAQALAGRLGDRAGAAGVVLFESVRAACEAAGRDARPDDRIVVCGSFHTVGEAMSLTL